MTAEAEKAKSQIKENVSELKFAQSPIYYLDLIYLKSDNNEYIVPFFQGNNMLKEEIYERIEDGKLYTADEFVQAMDNTYDIANIDPDSNGGIPIKPLSNVNAGVLDSVVKESDSSTNYLLIYSVIIGAAVIVIFSIPVIFKKKRKK